MDKTTNNRKSRKVTDNTMDKTTNNDLQEGYRQYNGQNYKQRSRGRLQAIQWTKLQTTISRKATDNTMDKTTNNRKSRKVTDNTMDKTTNNDLQEGYRQYNGQNYKQP